MTKPLSILLSLFCFTWQGIAQSHPAFIANEGQWKESFDYKYDLGSGAIFLQGNSTVVTMVDESALSILHMARHGEEVALPEYIKAHAYEVRLVGAKENATAISTGKLSTHYNYFIGNDEARWKSGVGAFREVLYEDVYPGIDAKYYFTHEGNLKYDFVVSPKADPARIVMDYIGVEGMSLKDGNLIIPTSVTDVVEMSPFAYQTNGEQRIVVDCAYYLEGNVVRFKVGEYNRKLPLIIDPELVFSTFSGSTADNFGFTATYSEDGGLYAGGIVFNDGGKYPSTRGAFQINFSGPRVDIAISKFSSDGSKLEYATYLGGTEDEIPYSLIETKDRQLVVFGSTGSDDFPTRLNAYDRTFAGGRVPMDFFSNEVSFPQGSDVFVCVIDSVGGGLPGSTLYGGTDNDGINSLDYNYGDQFRGEVITDSVGNIYIVGSTNSKNITVGQSAYLRQAPDSINGFVASFSPDLTTLRWASYIGGVGNDNALSAKMSPDFQRIYVVGGTLSNGMNFPNEAYQSTRVGNVDGYIVSLDASNGSFIAGTYNGTSERDVNYFVEVDYTGDIYVVGQTRGDYPIGADSILYQNPGSSQYIHMLSSDLEYSKRAMVFGNGSHINSNISPTAFMVDECKNLYVSGWGGQVNQGANHNQGFTRNMPITPNAFKSTTDGSDFYFFVLDASWNNLTYATYFGDINYDHVDGGTSRFAPDGTIYQAVCAGCFGNSYWPTTATAYSRYNLGGTNSCNLAALKMNFSAVEVDALAKVDVDSSCIPFSVKVSNESYNGDVYQWILPDGNIVNGNIDSLYISDKGKHLYKLIAIDTMCNSSDTFALPIYGFADSIQAMFKARYDSCSNVFEVNFENRSNDAITFHWDFGDGKQSNAISPKHFYNDEGPYVVRLIAVNEPCGIADTISTTLKFTKRASSNDFSIDYEPCRDANSVRFKAWGTHFQEYNWNFGNGETAEGKSVEHTFMESGKYRVSLQLSDTLCQRFFSKDTVIEIFTDGYTPWLPNVFTPNGDNVNDYFGIPESAHSEFFPTVDMKIFNRWGKLLYETSEANEPWDGTFENQKMAEGVYFYILNVEDACSNKKEFKGFVHLMNQ